jgi:hypothetical protein
MRARWDRPVTGIAAPLASGPVTGTSAFMPITENSRYKQVACNSVPEIVTPQVYRMIENTSISTK